MLANLRLLCLDSYILKPQWLHYLILVGVYLYEKEGRIGISVASMGFLFGILSKLLRWSIATSDFDPETKASEDALPDASKSITLKEASAGSKAVSAAGCVLGVTATFLSAHHGLRLYFAIPLGILVIWLGAHFLGFIWMAMSVWLEGKDRDSNLDTGAS